MPRRPVIGLVMATMLEAKPLVLELGLKELKKRPFRIFGNGRILLIISGIGKANAATACTHLIHTSDTALLCNLGAAGATVKGFDLGACFQISKVIEPDRPDLDTGMPIEHVPQHLKGFSSVILATQDKPVLTPNERRKISLMAQLVDMEGASVGQACRRYGKPCYLFKFVSDNPVHNQSHDIRSNISLYRDAFSGFFIGEVLPRLD
jgi:adenosylhomocysteine nucleosidase